MLTANEAQQLASRLRITPEFICREFYEMLILHEIANQSWSQGLIFKGGTALRLAYQSPRFSDDLDFTLTQPVAAKVVFNFIDKVARQYKLIVSDKHEKFATILGEFKITLPYLAQAFYLKIEISKRPFVGESQLKILTSPTAPLQVLISTLSLNALLNEKIAAWNERLAARDLFDIWYITQKINLDITSIRQQLAPFPINSRQLRAELQKYLPTNWYQAIDELTRLFATKR